MKPRTLYAIAESPSLVTNHWIESHRVLHLGACGGESGERKLCSTYERREKSVNPVH